MNLITKPLRKPRSDKGSKRKKKPAVKVEKCHIQCRINGMNDPESQAAAAYFNELKRVDLPKDKQTPTAPIIIEALNALHEMRNKGWKAPTSAAQMTTEIYSIMCDVADLLHEVRSMGGVSYTPTQSQRVSGLVDTIDRKMAMFQMDEVEELGAFADDD